MVLPAACARSASALLRAWTVAEDAIYPQYRRRLGGFLIAVREGTLKLKRDVLHRGRFAHVIPRTASDGEFSTFGIALARDNDNLRLGRSITDFGKGRKAVAVRQPDIQKRPRQSLGGLVRRVQRPA